MRNSIPVETIQTFAKTICGEASKYGFGQVDMVRLVNELLDVSADLGGGTRVDGPGALHAGHFETAAFPLQSDRLKIRETDPERDKALLNGWLDDQYGKHFLLSSMTAQTIDLESLLAGRNNKVGIITDREDEPVGAVAFLGIDKAQKKAELRKLIGKPSARGIGYAEEATKLWITYGGEVLGLQKIFVSTLQTHIRNIQLNEAIGFRVEGLLQREVLIAGQRHDLLRMGLCYDEFRP